MEKLELSKEAKEVIEKKLEIILNILGIETKVHLIDEYPNFKIATDAFKTFPMMFKEVIVFGLVDEVTKKVGRVS